VRVPAATNHQNGFEVNSQRPGKKSEMALMTETEELAGPLSAYGKARSTIAGAPLSAYELGKIDAYWRTCKYLALGMIYLQANPLLREPLKPEHVKNRLLGHWGSSPGLAFLYAHLSRLIKRDDLDMIFLAGPGQQEFRDCQIACRRFAYEQGIDSPEISGWKWPYGEE
jgi:phosphoketolase